MSKLPWEHPFQPDPLTPTACVICALHPQWHSRPLLYDDPASVERLADIVAPLRHQFAMLPAEDDSYDLARAIIERLREGR